jgi:formate C-acetyltransferase
MPNYKNLLQVGLNGIINEIEDRLRELRKELKRPIEDWAEQVNFLEAAIIVQRAVINFAHRFAGLARGMVKDEPSPERRKELEEIAETCDWVPANPPRTLYEAMQLTWLIFVVNRCIETAVKVGGEVRPVFLSLPQKDRAS